ncbi:MAG: TldD/PmbA family protein, partial [Chloroflexi bacterium]|nr:TldD/PmbA family protein [Chloroflexota bacterium]
PTAPVVDHVPPVLGQDPRAVPLARKKDILDGYNEIIWSTRDIQTSTIGYGDGSRRTIFANSEGSYIEQERVDVTLSVAAIARREGDIQQASFSLGSLGDFTLVEGQAEAVATTARRAGELLRASYPEARAYTVVLDPILAGVFTHEAFGHLSESDHISENPQMRDIMVLGKRFGPAHLNIVDGAAVGGLRGSYRYDDEGVPATRTDLIREGVLVGRLHSRETAGLMAEGPTGNARAINYRFPPIVRMTNTFIEPGELSLDQILADVDDGIYACNWYGGTTSMEMFTFSAGEAYRIRKGRVEELLRGAVLSGNLFQTLQNIDAIGNDLAMNQGGGCGKRGQSPLPVANGSPHIRIRDCVVGGK